MPCWSNVCLKKVLSDLSTNSPKVKRFDSSLLYTMRAEDLKPGVKAYLNIDIAIKQASPFYNKLKLKKLREAGINQIPVKVIEDTSKVSIRAQLNRLSDDANKKIVFETEEYGRIFAHPDQLKNKVHSIDIKSHIDIPKREEINIVKEIWPGFPLDPAIADIRIAIMENGRVIEMGKSNFPLRTYDEYELKFDRVYNETHSLVSGDFNDQKIRLLVPHQFLSVPKITTKEEVLKRLSFLDDIELDFSVNQLVRIRDNEGLMRTGVVRKALKESVEVILEDNRIIQRNQKDVFRSVHARSRTPYYENSTYARGEISEAVFQFSQKPEGVFRKILDGAARLSSTSEYQSLEEIDQVNFLGNYIKKFLQTPDGAAAIERRTGNKINEVFCQGTGVCRHQAIALATVLQEAGYKANLKTHFVDKLKFGHVWVELEIDGKIYILDTGTSLNEMYIKTFEEAKVLAEKTPESMESIFYTNPSVTTINPSY